MIVKEEIAIVHMEIEGLYICRAMGDSERCSSAFFTGRNTAETATLQIEIEGVDGDRRRGGTRIAAAALSSPVETQLK